MSIVVKKEVEEEKKEEKPKTEERDWKCIETEFEVMGNSLYVGCYLIKGKNGKYFMIDTGAPTSFEKQVKPHIEGIEIDYLLNTHSHYDHFGGNQSMKKLLGDKMPKVIAHTIAAKNMKTGNNGDMSAKNIFMKPIFNIMMFFGKNDKSIMCDTDIQIDEDHPLDSAIAKYLKENYDIEILMTTGHTQDSMSVYRKEHSELFIGDCLYKGKDANDFGEHDQLNPWNRKKYFECLKRFIDLKPKSIIASHVKPIITPEQIQKKYENCAFKKLNLN